MNIQHNLGTQRMCRTCMWKEIEVNSVANPNTLQSIFSPLESHIQIAELLATTVPQLLIEPLDDLPKLICSDCVQKAVELHQFQQLCINSEQCLRSVLCVNENESKYVQIPEQAIPLSESDVRNEDPLQSSMPVPFSHDIHGFVKLEIKAGEINQPKLESEDLKKYKNMFDESTCSATAVKSEDESETKSFSSDASTEQDEVDKNLRPMSESIYLSRITTTTTLATNQSESARIDTGRRDVPVVSKVEGYQCEKCPRRFAKQKSLIVHQKAHAKNIDTASLLSCEICHKEFKKMHALTRHKRTRHINQKAEENVSKPFVCEYCNKAFQQSCTLKDHLRTHTGEQPFLCSECGKAFNSSSNMKQHLLRHSGLKRYECPDCPKKFPCLSDLASHKAVHRKIKPHCCDICGASFGKPYQLKKHKMYHNGEKPHKCEYCEMRFVCADHMRRHMRTHTGEKPYKCRYCDRAFAQSNDLIKHLRSHLGENVYKCELCPKAFRLATELREHFVEHKNDNDETRERNLKAMMEEEEKVKVNLKL